MKIVHSLSRIMGYMATAVLGLMMLLTVVDVFLRYFFSAPIIGAAEITELMLIIVVFPALAWCALKGQHIRVSLLTSILPQRAKAIFDIITLLATLATFIIITWQSFLESLEVDTETSLIGFPEAPFFWILTLGFALFCASIATLVIEKIARAVKA